MVTLMKRTAGRTLRPVSIDIAMLALVAFTAGAALVGCGTNKVAPEGTQSQRRKFVQPRKRRHPTSSPRASASSASIPLVTSNSGPTRSA